MWRPSEDREREQADDDDQAAEAALPEPEVQDRVHEEHGQRSNPPVPPAVESASDDGDGRDAEGKEHAHDVAHVPRAERSAGQRLVVDALEEHGQHRECREREREPPLVVRDVMHDVVADHVGRDQACRPSEDLPREPVRSSNRAHLVPPVDVLYQSPFGRKSLAERNYFTIKALSKQFMLKISGRLGRFFEQV